MHPLHRVAELLHAAADEITGYADTFPVTSTFGSDTPAISVASGTHDTMNVTIPDAAAEQLTEETSEPAADPEQPAQPAEPETIPDPPEGHFPDGQPVIGGVATSGT